MAATLHNQLVKNLNLWHVSLELIIFFTAKIKKNIGTMNDICLTMIYLVTCVIIEIQSIFFIVDKKQNEEKFEMYQFTVKTLKNILVQWYLLNIMFWVFCIIPVIELQSTIFIVDNKTKWRKLRCTK